MSNQADKESVLPALNRDGTRRWIRPRLAPGRFLNRRRVVAYALIVLFAALPFLRIGGRPAMLIDITSAELSLFGMVFRPSDGFLLMLLGLTVVTTVLLVTALFGRVWCGWGCPQTVYLEHIFRPIERWIEGSVGQQKAMDKKGWPTGRRIIGWGIFLMLSFVVANIFLAYFVGTDRLFKWVTSSPAEHPGGFATVMIVTGLMFADFAYFREQVCIIACPYGRLQSTLLDTQSLIVAYDAGRGEPRTNLKRKLPMLAETPAVQNVAHDAKALPLTGGVKPGSCIDCNACVAVCPTGIDIRQGLQLECVGCAQCIDVCDSVMDKVQQPRGLIRYTSQDQLAGKTKKILRVRTVVYPVLLVTAFILLVMRADSRSGTDVWVLRVNGPAFVDLGNGVIASSVRIKLENKGDAIRNYTFELKSAPDAKLRMPIPNWKVKPRSSVEVPLFVDVPVASFVHGQRTVVLKVSEDGKVISTIDLSLPGPEGQP